MNDLDKLRHSTAHLLAAAVLELYPEAKPTIGPPIENGFYYDFDDLKISEEDLPKIEAKMQELVKTWDKFELVDSGVAQNDYKQELLDNLTEKPTYYKSGNFIDLCAGPHVDDAKKIKFFKLLKLAGAYWHGDEKNKMLTRIYGTAFYAKEELDKYLWQVDEAKKRDNRKLGKELELFHLDETAPGMPYWLPKGLIILNTLLDFWRKEHESRGYQEISSPLINKKELYVTSGHWDHYKDNMFIAEDGDENTWCLKPMNCPNAMIVYGLKSRSYKNLPLRLSDCDVLHRNEKSGTLQGLLRVQHIQQDDAHIFVTEDQIEDEYNRILDIADKFYSIFGLEFHYRFGARPDEFMGDPKVWDKAEEALIRILDKRVGRDNYVTGEKEGAFYGPKIDILMKDAIGREWQMGTVQLDFQLPQRFNLKYIDATGKEVVPVVIHRVIYGSLERFIGIMIEHFAGAFPTWLSPVQVAVLPIADRHNDYANEILNKLKENNIRVEIDTRADTLGAKIRDHQMQKVPYMLIIGDKEVEAKTVAERGRSGKQLAVQPIEEFIKNIKIEIDTKSLD
ncbi:MAG: threonine--tRNA ligase [bacterium]|nr:threonine--tRNA ligase [bacterium]